MKERILINTTCSESLMNTEAITDGFRITIQQVKSSSVYIPNTMIRFYKYLQENTEFDDIVKLVELDYHKLSSMLSISDIHQYIVKILFSAKNHKMMISDILTKLEKTTLDSTQLIKKRQLHNILYDLEDMGIISIKQVVGSNRYEIQLLEPFSDNLEDYFDLRLNSYLERAEKIEKIFAQFISKKTSVVKKKP